MKKKIDYIEKIMDLAAKGPWSGIDISGHRTLLEKLPKPALIDIYKMAKNEQALYSPADSLTAMFAWRDSCIS